MATEFALLIVEADICRVLTFKTELTTNFVQTSDLIFGEFLRSAEKSGIEEKFSVEFYGFHLMISVEKAVRISERAVVSEKNGVEILKIFGNRVRNFFGGRSAVFRNGNAS